MFPSLWVAGFKCQSLVLFLTVVYHCFSPISANFSLHRRYLLSEHQRSTEYEVEIEMNGLLSG